MKETPDRSGKAGDKLSKQKARLLLAAFMVFAASAPSMPTEEDFFNLANELEKNPPADLTSDDIKVVTKILRGE